MTTLTDEQARELALNWLEPKGLEVIEALEMRGRTEMSNAIREGRQMADYILSRPSPGVQPNAGAIGNAGQSEGSAHAAPTHAYRKKPVVIEAWQWHGDPHRTLIGSGAPDWLVEAETVYGTLHPGSVRVVEESDGTGYLAIKTLEGEMTAAPGDWVIRGVKGELYPCKPDIFAATYEPGMGASATFQDHKDRAEKEDRES